jgi:hypothetical protein
MQNNSDLIGKTYRNGEDGVIRYRVTAIDSEFPSLVHFENLLTQKTGCALADFVRPFLEK